MSIPWSAADLLKRCQDRARKAPGDPAVTPGRWFDWLTEAQQEVYLDFFARFPDFGYSAPQQLFSDDGGFTYNFGTDSQGDPIFPWGHVELYPNLQSVPDNPLVPGEDFLFEAGVIRSLHNRPMAWAGGPVARFIADPDDPIDTTHEPLLQPKSARMLLVLKALEKWASRRGSGGNPLYWKKEYDLYLDKMYARFSTAFNREGGQAAGADGERRWWYSADFATSGAGLAAAAAAGDRVARGGTLLTNAAAMLWLRAGRGSDNFAPLVGRTGIGFNTGGGQGTEGKGWIPQVGRYGIWSFSASGPAPVSPVLHSTGGAPLWHPMVNPVRTKTPAVVRCRDVVWVQQTVGVNFGALNFTLGDGYPWQDGTLEAYRSVGFHTHGGGTWQAYASGNVNNSPPNPGHIFDTGKSILVMCELMFEIDSELNEIRYYVDGVLVDTYAPVADLNAIAVPNRTPFLSWGNRPNASTTLKYYHGLGIGKLIEVETP